ncbi:hypothetical protein G7Y89_g10953 [Cudoniella acicularis]|uniref:Uncharacterized protein n=1 Tax=Cudoniella acicularis TaxID=354080 RepID=A0A8H4VYI2_9HELO|nr:hypothetical protein G7Y89_g10953 [Cudoniella acicularis]
MASDIIPVTVPISLALSATILGFYLLAALLLLVRVHTLGSENFSLLRILAAAIAFGVLKATGLQALDTALLWLITALYDFGAYFIVMSLLQTALIISEYKGNRLIKIIRGIWGVLILIILGAGWLMEITFEIQTEPSTNDPHPQSSNPSLEKIGHILHGMAITLLVATMGIASVFPAKSLLSRWTKKGFVYSNWIQSLAFYITLIPLGIRIIFDLLRVWAYHEPTAIENVVTGVIPELLIVTLWLYLAQVIIPWGSRVKRLTPKAAGIFLGLWFGWKVPGGEYRYLIRQHRIITTANFGAFLPEEVVSTEDSVEVPGLFNYIDYFTSSDIAFRRENMMLRPDVLAVAEKLMPALSVPYPLAAKSTPRPFTGGIKQKIGDFDSASEGRVGFFQQEVWPREGEYSELATNPSSIAMTSMNKLWKPPPGTIDFGSEAYNRADMLEFISMLRTLVEVALASMCLKVPLEQSVFSRPMWVVDMPESLEKMKSALDRGAWNLGRVIIHDSATFRRPDKKVWKTTTLQPLSISEALFNKNIIIGSWLITASAEEDGNFTASSGEPAIISKEVRQKSHHAVSKSISHSKSRSRRERLQQHDDYAEIGGNYESHQDRRNTAEDGFRIDLNPRGPRSAVHNQSAFPSIPSPKLSTSRGMQLDQVISIASRIHTTSPAQSSSSRVNFTEKLETTPAFVAVIYDEDILAENVATTLEFLAGGRQRDIGVSPSSTTISPGSSSDFDILSRQQAKLVLDFHQE